MFQYQYNSMKMMYFRVQHKILILWQAKVFLQKAAINIPGSAFYPLLVNVIGIWNMSGKTR